MRTWLDAVVAAAALVAVVEASTVMEVTATGVGRYAVVGIVTGGLVRAVVISMPNAVSAVYLARRAAALSTTLNSSAINVVAGPLISVSRVRAAPGRVCWWPRGMRA